MSGDLARWANPVSLLFGAGAVDAVGRECAAFGRRALVVCDPGVARLPVASVVLERLAEARVGAERFPGVVSSPGLDVVRDGCAAARRAGAEVVVGLGGGSAMDVAKTVAAAVRAPWLLELDGASGLAQPADLDGAPPLPLVQVPTTHATGSELNPIASLTDDRGAKRLLVHPRLYARVAIVDPALHLTVPAAQTAEGSLETLCRVIVPYLTDAAGRLLPDRQAEAIAAALLARTTAALAAPADLGAREDLALATVASVRSLAAFGRSRYGHVLWYLGNALAGRGLTKGQALAPLLRVQLEPLAGGDAPPALGHPHRLARLGTAVLGTPPEPTAAAGGLLTALGAWGLPPRLSGVSEADVAGLAAETRALWDGAPLAGLSDADLEAIYRAAL